ncbi:hypothetical protein Tco_0966775 [Tanacetum coccineum]
MKMVPYEAFACRCGARYVVLRESYKPKTRVRLLVSSPRASTPPSYSPGPSTPPSYSPGPSRNAECSNCKLLLGNIKVLEATVEMMSVEEDFKWWQGLSCVREVAAQMKKQELLYSKEQSLMFVPAWWFATTTRTSEFLKKRHNRKTMNRSTAGGPRRGHRARAREKCIFIEKD